MKYVICFIVTFLLFSCGKETLVVQGPPGLDGKNAVVPVSMEGYYVLPNGSYLDVYEDAQGLNNIREGRLVLLNADGSSSIIPLSSASKLPTVSDHFYYNVNLSYSATHNVKQDSNNTVLTGSLFTEFVFAKDVTGKLTVRIIINSASSVLFDHVLN